MCAGCTPVDELEVRIKELHIPHAVPCHQVPAAHIQGEVEVVPPHAHHTPSCCSHSVCAALQGYHLRVHCGHGSDGGGVQLHQFQWLTDVWLQQSCADECMQEAKEMQLDSTHASLPHTRWCTMRTPGSVHCYLARTMLSPLHLSFPSPVHSLLAALPPTPLLIPLRWCSRQWLCRGGRNILRGDPASC